MVLLDIVCFGSIWSGTTCLFAAAVCSWRYQSKQDSDTFNYGGKAHFQSFVYKKIEYQRYEEPFQVLFVPFACILAMLFNELFILLATKLKALNRT